MSRSYKKPYTKSKAVDKSCRCNGGCPYCLSNRMHKNKKKTQEKKDKLLWEYLTKKSI